MFAVVKFDQEPKGLFKKLFWRFSKREVNAEKVSVAPGVFFFFLRCNFTPEHADWDLIEDAAGAMKNRLIFPEDIRIPEKFTPLLLEKLRQRAFIKTAFKILKSEKCESVTIDDRNGIFINDIENFVNLAPLIRVITNTPERYDSVCERIMEKSGATLLLCDENADLGRTWLVTYRGGSWHGESIKAITAADVCFGAEKLIRLSKLNFNEEYLSLVPEGIDRDKFLPALYEYSHADFLENTLLAFEKACGT